jgi:predicted nuclease with TOPRIM domain
MKEQLQTRLDELKREFELGQNKLHEIESEEASLRQTLLRISGAIQVLEETLASEQDGEEANENAANA